MNVQHSVFGGMGNAGFLGGRRSWGNVGDVGVVVCPGCGLFYIYCVGLKNSLFFYVRMKLIKM